MRDDEILLFEIWNSAGELVVSDGDLGHFSSTFRERHSENFSEAGFRNVYRTTDRGAVRFITKEDSPYFQGRAARERACLILAALAPQFKKIRTGERQRYEAVIKRFAHNLIKFQTRFKGNFSRLISDAARARPYSELKAEVRRRIDIDIERAAHDICQMSHRAIDLDAQIATLRVIAGYAERNQASNKIKVNLQKGMYRLTNPFVEELLKKNIEIQVNVAALTSESEKVLVDHDLFNASIWQILDNASKYVLEGTPIEITASLSSRPQELCIAMTSVRVEPDEYESIFIEGYKGRHAGNKAESGIGLYVVRKALGLMGATIKFHSEGEAGMHNGFLYSRNVFTIKFALQ